MTKDEFIRYFVSALVRRGYRSFHVNSVQDRRSVQRLHEYIDELVKQKYRVSASMGRDFYHLVRLRNELAPGSLGTFDGFEGLLRNLQYVMTSSQNPSLDIIRFEVSKEDADRIYETMNETDRQLIDGAVEAFMGDQYAEVV